MGRKVFDSHFHIFDLQVRAKYPNQNESHGFPGPEQAKINRNHLADEAETALASAEVHEGVFVQCYNDCPEELDWVHSQFEGKEFVKGIVGGLDPLKLDKFKRNVEKFMKMTPKLVGVRHLIGFEAVDYIAREDVHEGLQVLADNGLTFDLHSYPDTLKYIPHLAKGVPKLKMVIDHIAKPYYHDESTFSVWCDDISGAAACPNVYCKLSGLINEVQDWSVEKFKPYVDHCIKEFGVSRCFYGSDWPVCKLATPDIEYSSVVGLLEGLLSELSGEEKDDIFYNNARKFYGLN